MSIDFNSLNTIYKTFFINRNYEFTKEKVDVMDSIIINYDKLTNIQLSLKIAFIFSYYFNIDMIRHIISKCNEPIRAFVLYKLGRDNLSFDNESLSFKYQKTPLFEYLITVPTALLGFYYIFKFVIISIINYNNLIEIFTISNLINPIIGLLLAIPFFSILNSKMYARMFLKLSFNKTDNKTSEEERVTPASI